MMLDSTVFYTANASILMRLRGYVKRWTAMRAGNVIRIGLTAIRLVIAMMGGI